MNKKRVFNTILPYRIACCFQHRWKFQLDRSAVHFICRYYWTMHFPVQSEINYWTYLKKIQYNKIKNIMNFSGSRLSVCMNNSKTQTNWPHIRDGPWVRLRSIDLVADRFFHCQLRIMTITKSCGRTRLANFDMARRISHTGDGFRKLTRKIDHCDGALGHCFSKWAMDGGW